MSNVKQAIIKTKYKSFFKHWLTLTEPLHKLNKKEIEVLALLLYYYFEFKKEINNDNLSWKLTFDHDTKSKIINELNLSSDQILQNVLTALRKKKIVLNNKINQSFIPEMDLTKSNIFSIIYKFEING